MGCGLVTPVLCVRELGIHQSREHRQVVVSCREEPLSAKVAIRCGPVSFICVELIDLTVSDTPTGPKEKNKKETPFPSHSHLGPSNPAPTYT